MFVNSHIATGYLAGKIAKQDSKWILLLIFSTVFPDIDGLWSNTVAGHHSILHAPIFWIFVLLIGTGIGKFRKDKIIEKTVLIIFIGAMRHLITDWLTARTVGIRWFFPFSETMYWIYPIQPEKGQIPIWDMVVAPYFPFYFQNKVLAYGEVAINLIALCVFGKGYLKKK